MDIKIRRPDAVKHFMVLKPIARRIIVRLATGSLLANSTNAIRLLESGKTLYDPVIYLPRQDIKFDLLDNVEQTFCPLKGTASYFDHVDYQVRFEKLAWSYLEPHDFAQEIKGLVAFYADKVIIEEHPV